MYIQTLAHSHTRARSHTHIYISTHTLRCFSSFLRDRSYLPVIGHGLATRLSLSTSTKLILYIDDAKQGTWRSTPLNIFLDRPYCPTPSILPRLVDSPLSNSRSFVTRISTSIYLGSSLTPFSSSYHFCPTL